MYTFITWNEKNNNEPNTICGKNYEEFLTLCFNAATTFTFTFTQWGDTCTDLQDELQPFFIREFYTKTWFGYDYTFAPKGDERDMQILEYKATAEAKAILQKYMYDIFMQTYHNGALHSNVQTLEDLCFFQGNKLLAGTVTHEYMLAVIPRSAEMHAYVENNNQWEYEEDDNSFYISEY